MFFKKPSTGSVCGRFMEDQWNRDMNSKEKDSMAEIFLPLPAPWIFNFYESNSSTGKVKVTQKETEKVVCSPACGRS